ncbi:FeoB-associated Cys-rich membrane protein [Desulfobotulus sp. H1]|uniref:FeoB-associated Cys-rich membrane protein n=1 Tax=Desulfobotulus pelophilus TaxID=2823377 RepID=A0ABT3NBK9_9BACT|nr:FeoB-associated Cys-rich membrane protein [Desulfobotulus pelophilus]MCW7754855.1 FeoB-associated Cys-rich membrane protein [Desulfobotulus pelophilus]
MFWEYLILIAIVAWAIFYLWHIFFRKKGCSCDSCPSACDTSCTAQKLGIHYPESDPANKKGEDSQSEVKPKK